MEYDIYYKRSAVKELSRLPKRDFYAVKAAIEALRDDPTPPGVKAMKGNYMGYYRIRQGNYRVIYEVNHKEIIITIIKIGNRKNIYE